MEHIKKFVDEHKYEEALEELLKWKYKGANAVLTDYCTEKEIKSFGLITNEEWEVFERTVIRKRILRMLEEGVEKETEPGKAAPVRTGPRVFISYNASDKDMANSVYAYLCEQPIVPAIDHIHKTSKEDVRTFIIRQVQQSEYVILLISKESLSSGWVNIESGLAMNNEILQNAKLLLLSVDGGHFDDDNQYFFVVSRKIDDKIKETQECIDRAKAEGHNGPIPFDDTLLRLKKTKNQLGETFKYFKEKGRTINIAGGNFEAGMKKVCNDILNY
jgi:hypothetical protein